MQILLKRRLMPKENKSKTLKTEAMIKLRYLLNNAHFGQVYEHQLSDFIDAVMLLVKEELKLPKKE
jgi:hypothetical protein